MEITFLIIQRLKIKIRNQVQMELQVHMTHSLLFQNQQGEIQIILLLLVPM